MILALLLAQASAVDAERAFAADAQKLGQWTAFRKWAADDAVMFWPQPVNAQEKLKTLTDPPKSVEWKPARSFVSCDGTVAANTGPWRQPDGSIGYFSTIWVKQPGGGWKWTVDGGDAVKTPKFEWGAATKVQRAACPRVPPPPIMGVPRPPNLAGGEDHGSSPDGSLTWYWMVDPDGARRFSIALYRGERRGYEAVIHDRIEAPKPAAP